MRKYVFLFVFVLIVIGSFSYVLGTGLNTIKSSNGTKDVERGAYICERSLTADIYCNLNGLKTAQISLKPKNYYNKENQKYEPINLTIVPSSSKEFDYENKKNVFESYFKVDSKSENTIKFRVNDSWIAYSLQNNELGEINNVKGYPSGNKFIYPRVFNDVDLHFTITNEKLLEEFILHHYMNISRITQKVEFSHEVYFKEQESGGIKFFKKGTNELLWTVPKPFMYELNPRENGKKAKNYGLHYEITKTSENEFLISKVLDKEGKDWLLKEERVYPVVIDLTQYYKYMGYDSKTGYLEKFGYDSWFDDCYHSYLEAENATPSSGLGTYEVGMACSTMHQYWIYRQYVSFDTSVLNNTDINFATLQEPSYGDFYCWMSDSNTFTVKVYGGSQPIYGNLDSGDWGSGTQYLDDLVTCYSGGSTGGSADIPPSQINTNGNTQFELISDGEGSYTTGNEYLSISDIELYVGFYDEVNPTAEITEPGIDGQEKGSDFSATFRYEDKGSGLSSCQYQVQTKDSGNWLTTVSWTSAGSCSGNGPVDLSKTITVAPSTGNCRNVGSNTCRIQARADDVSEDASWGYSNYRYMDICWANGVSCSSSSECCSNKCEPDDGWCFSCTISNTDDQDNNCEADAGCGASPECDEKSPSSCLGDTSYCSSSCQLELPDDSESACECNQGVNNWNLGGEVPDKSKCCGNDPGEYSLTRNCEPDACLSDSSDNACCDSNTDCVYDSGCYSVGYSGDVDGDGENEYCHVSTPGKWASLPADTTPPNTTATGINDSGGLYNFNTWTTSTYVNVTLICNDKSGCDKTLYCIDNTGTCIPDLEYSAPLQISTEGISYIRFKSNDTLGNEETVNSKAIKIEIREERIPPPKLRFEPEYNIFPVNLDEQASLKLLLENNLPVSDIISLRAGGDALNLADVEFQKTPKLDCTDKTNCHVNISSNNKTAVYLKFFGKKAGQATLYIYALSSQSNLEGQKSIKIVVQSEIGRGIFNAPGINWLLFILIGLFGSLIYLKTYLNSR